MTTCRAVAIQPLRQHASISDCHIKRSLIVKACAPTGSLSTCRASTSLTPDLTLLLMHDLQDLKQPLLCRTQLNVWKKV